MVPLVIIALIIVVKRSRLYHWVLVLRGACLNRHVSLDVNLEQWALESYLSWLAFLVNQHVTFSLATSEIVIRSQVSFDHRYEVMNSLLKSLIPLLPASVLIRRLLMLILKVLVEKHSVRWVYSINLIVVFDFNVDPACFVNFDLPLAALHFLLLR